MEQRSNKAELSMEIDELRFKLERSQSEKLPKLMKEETKAENIEVEKYIKQEEVITDIKDPSSEKTLEDPIEIANETDQSYKRQIFELKKKLNILQTKVDVNILSNEIGIQ